MLVCSPAQKRLFILNEARCVTPELLLSLPARSISKQFYPSPKTRFAANHRYLCTSANAICQTLHKRSPGDELTNKKKRIYNTIGKGEKVLLTASSAAFLISLQTDVKNKQKNT